MRWRCDGQGMGWDVGKNKRFCFGLCPELTLDNAPMPPQSGLLITFK